MLRHMRGISMMQKDSPPNSSENKFHRIPHYSTVVHLGSPQSTVVYNYNNIIIIYIICNVKFGLYPLYYLNYICIFDNEGSVEYVVVNKNLKRQSVNECPSKLIQMKHTYAFYTVLVYSSTRYCLKFKRDLSIKKTVNMAKNCKTSIQRSYYFEWI